MKHVSHDPELTVKDPVIVIEKGPLFVIDRTKLPTVSELLGDEWTLWKGSKDGEGLEGEGEQDPRSVVCSEFDLGSMRFVHCFKEGEGSINGEEKWERIKASPYVRPDFTFGIGLFLEKGQTTLKWLYDTHGVTWFEIPDVLCHDGGYRYFLILSREGSGLWHWDYRWLKHERRRGWLTPLFQFK